MQYMYSKTGDEGSIYAARQGMRACNNNNMRNPPTSFIMGLRMLVLLHALIPSLAAYILPSSPVYLANKSSTKCGNWCIPIITLEIKSCNLVNSSPRHYFAIFH